MRGKWRKQNNINNSENYAREYLDGAQQQVLIGPILFPTYGEPWSSNDSNEPVIQCNFWGAIVLIFVQMFLSVSRLQKLVSKLFFFTEHWASQTAALSLLIPLLLFVDRSEFDADAIDRAQHHSGNQFGIKGWVCDKFVLPQGQSSGHFHFIQGKVLTNAVPEEEKHREGKNRAVP